MTIVEGMLIAWNVILSAWVYITYEKHEVLSRVAKNNYCELKDIADGISSES